MTTPPTTSPSRSTAQPRRTVAAGLACSALAIGLTGCGRSAPVDALSELSTDPEIAGVSVTSTEAVVATVPTVEGDTVPPSSEVVPQPQATYTIEPGDTLSVIADLYDVTIESLAAFNGITDVNSIRPGQQLVIPPAPVEAAPVEPVATEPTPVTQP